MKTLLIFTLFLISGGGESIDVTGYSGGRVLIKCRYETRYTSNPKYLCTGSWPCLTKPIWTKTKNKWINSGRFSLFDDTRAAQFWVLIRELTVEDSGLYQCGVDKDWAIDVYRPVELKVKRDQNYKKSIDVVGHVGGGVNISCRYPQSHRSDPKFLCKRVGFADCSYKSSVKESRRWINEGQLHPHDDGKQIFTVSFNRLTEGDSGEYWCGAESDWTSDPGYKVYITQINLRVTGTASPSTSPSSPAAQTKETNASTTTKKPSFKTSTGSSVVTGVSVIVLLLLFGLLFFIVFLRKRGKTQGQLPTFPSDSSASATQRSAGTSTEVPTYATVNFNKKAGRASDAVTRTAFSSDKDSCDYATIKR
ncbi:hypothetical protein MHYP_G00103600 [Metynnis hypsauchen]